MSRLPPVPPASKPVHGPEEVAKTSVDISHRVRHQAQRAAEGIEGAGEVFDEGELEASRGSTWLLFAVIAALGLGYFAGRKVA